MKIAIVTDRIYPFYTGGYEYFLYKIGLRLCKEWDLSVVTSFPSMNPDQVVNCVNYVKFSPFKNFTNSKGEHSVLGIMKFFSSAVTNARLLKGYDLVILNSIPYVGISYLIDRIKKNSKVAVIFYEAWYDYPNGGLLNFFKRYGLRNRIRKIVDKADYLFSISRSTTNSLEINYRAKKVITTPLGIDNDSVSKSVPSLEKFDLVYLGRLAAIKHVEDLILAVEILKKKGTDLKVAIIGDGPLRKVLDNLVEERNLKQNVKFLGKIPDPDKFSVLKSSRIFVMPSEREGFSIATLEAMACGCVPVVAVPRYPELFGMNHFVKDKINGAYFTLSDIGELASIIYRLSSDNLYYLNLQSAALKDSREYSWESCLDVFESFIRRIF